MDLVQLMTTEADVKGCLDSEYGGDIRKFAADLEALIDSKYPPSVRLVDLNGDNKPEYLISGPTQKCGFCGSGGCAFYIYQKWSDPDGYRLLLKGEGGLRVERTMTSGYRDLEGAFQGGAGDVAHTTYKYIEGEYKPAGCRRVIIEPGKRPRTLKC